MRARLAAGGRFGILTNAPRGLGRSGIEQTLAALGVDGFFSSDLIIDAAVLPAALPDRRAFAVAAVFACVPIDRCRYVGARPDLLAAARGAGLQVDPMEFDTGDGELPVRPRGGAGDDSQPTPADSPSGSRDLAGPFRIIDEDVGPTFVLEGRIATMSRAASWTGGWR